MIDTIYVETAVARYERAENMIKRFPDAACVTCDRYQEVFNPKAQNFRLQKKKPALILAKKFGATVLPAPEGYGIGGEHNYYFSHMLNCIYDCRYCFLQGMYRSAHYVVFVNYERFFDGMAEKLNNHGGEDVWFFSGYDCDSLALEPVTGFVRELLAWLRRHPRAQVELRTKSTQIRSLFETAPLSNVVIAYSLTPDQTAATLEHKAPSVEKRLAALAELAERGWNVGLRFDPVLYELRYQDLYQKLFEDVFDRVPQNSIHSVTLGPFRMPKPYFRNVTRLYPDEALFAGPFESRDKMISYSKDCEQQMMSFCHDQLLRHTAADKIFTCSPSSRDLAANRLDRNDLVGIHND